MDYSSLCTTPMESVDRNWTKFEIWNDRQLIPLSSTARPQQAFLELIHRGPEPVAALNIAFLPSPWPIFWSDLARLKRLDELVSVFAPTPC